MAKNSFNDMIVRAMQKRDASRVALKKSSCGAVMIDGLTFSVSAESDGAASSKGVMFTLSGEAADSGELTLDMIDVTYPAVAGVKTIRRKAELFERLGDARKTRSIKLGDVGGIDAHNNLMAGRDQFLDLRDVADVLLGVLRTDGHAVAAENAVAGNDLCVTLIDADGLDRAEPDAFVAVFAVGLFETQNIHVAPAFL